MHGKTRLKMSTLNVPLTNFHNNGCENWFLTTLLKNILVQYKELDVVLISSGTVIVHKKKPASTLVFVFSSLFFCSGGYYVRYITDVVEQLFWYSFILAFYIDYISILYNHLTVNIYYTQTQMAWCVGYFSWVFIDLILQNKHNKCSFN